MKKEEKIDIKRISLIGDLSDWGKHVYFNDMGVTLCGCFTVDYDKEKFKGMPDGVTSEYKEEEWDITCKKCLQMTDLFTEINAGVKAKNN